MFWMNLLGENGLCVCGRVADSSRESAQKRALNSPSRLAQEVLRCTEKYTRMQPALQAGSAVPQLFFMLVVMQEGAEESQIQKVIDRLVSMGFIVHRSSGIMHTVLGGVGPVGDVDPVEFEVMEGVKECHRIVSPYKLASRHFRPGGTVVKIRDVEIGGNQVVVMAGPCSVETRDQIEQIAAVVARGGAKVIRGGAFKPRSSPYSFQGLGEEGLKMMRESADRHNLLVVSEVMDQTQIPVLCAYSDILQVGARNMQNFNLLRELGQIRKPILLKRGISATIEELLLSAEYIMSGGNYEVILCERGIRTFENSTRNTMDISAIPVVKSLSHLPIVADPSHGTGRRDKVLPMARAAVAAGADGLLVEVHHDPDHALSDGAQSLRPQQFTELMDQLRMIARAVERSV
jgi:3-deoxy-7-phosphoheptulonate synthase